MQRDGRKKSLSGGDGGVEELGDGLPQLDELVDQVSNVRIGRKIEWGPYFLMGLFLAFVWAMYKVRMGKRGAMGVRVFPKLTHPLQRNATQRNSA